MVRLCTCLVLVYRSSSVLVCSVLVCSGLVCSRSGLSCCLFWSRSVNSLVLVCVQLGQVRPDQNNVTRTYQTRPEQDRTGQNRTGPVLGQTRTDHQDRPRQTKTDQDRPLAGQNRPEQTTLRIRIRILLTGPDRPGQDMSGQTRTEICPGLF